MKTLTLGFWSSFVLVSQIFAGVDASTEKEAETSAVRPQWYAETEWNFGVFGAYAFPNSEIRNNRAIREPTARDLTDGYLNTDHAWGGGIDAKYFFHRYFGLGVEGEILTANSPVPYLVGGDSTLLLTLTQRERREIGLALGTFTFRYPIGGSRFAPYAYAGVGAIFGGGEQSVLRGSFPEFVIQRSGTRAEAVGQFGAGMEFRLTPSIGITADFSWNVVNGGNNNFGMVRSGLNFAFSSLAFAETGPSAMKERDQSRASSPWYADTEWNTGILGAYAFSSNKYSHDRYLDADHAWGGGMDAKYFFDRYFGLGIEGDILDAERIRVEKNGSATFGSFFGKTSRTTVGRAVSSVLATFTMRYPIPSTRLAPFVCAGVGATFGGGEQDIITGHPDPYAGNTSDISTKHTGSRTELVGRFGGGIEFRLTPHIGIINDFSWNVVNRRNNNFGMVRSGLNFAF